MAGALVDDGKGLGVAPSGPGCEPTASAAVCAASSQSRIPNAVICTFCGKSNREVPFMVARFDDRAAMCSECLAEAVRAGERHEALASSIEGFARAASGTEAATAGETGSVADGLDPKGDGPTGEAGDAQPTPPSSKVRGEQ